MFTFSLLFAWASVSLKTAYLHLHEVVELLHFNVIIIIILVYVPSLPVTCVLFLHQPSHYPNTVAFWNCWIALLAVQKGYVMVSFVVLLIEGKSVLSVCSTRFITEWITLWMSIWIILLQLIILELQLH